MDRIIAPYGRGDALERPSLARLSSVAAAHPAKTGHDYAMALRRRWWLALATALVVIVVGIAIVLRLPSVYQAIAEIKIVPPTFDPALSVIVDSAANLNRDNTEQFILDKITQLRGKGLIDRVVREFEPGDAKAAAMLASEVARGLVNKRIPATNTFVVTLESGDQDRVAKILNSLLTDFVNTARQESRATLDESIREANRSLDRLEKELDDLDGEIQEIVTARPEFTPAGINLVESEYLELKSVLLQKRLRLDDLVYERQLADLWPHLRDRGGARGGALDEQIAELLSTKRQIELRMDHLRRTARSHHNDPMGKLLKGRLEEIDNYLAQLRPGGMQGPDLATMHVDRASDEVGQIEKALLTQKARLQESAPMYQEYLGHLKHREELESLISSTEERKLKFESVAGTLTAPVVVNQRASDPLAPARPNRILGIALASVAGIVAGIGLVCLLESADHSVKAPEQLVDGVSLPLLCVVPRMRRVARLCRGGHLWTPAWPDSIEADAFRNVRASVLGAERPDRPNVTILVTSAKAGEGKSTTALNLAAAFARSGERTLLVDCDLRRPSLGEVFGVDSSVGLVEVLRSEIPWQRALVDCEQVPNLSFLPAGTLGGLPIEILGSLELKQILMAVARNYHRVILDGPAIVGMAEGRLLGSMADATLLVVRSGSHEVGTLRTTREMLAQSNVTVAGIVFNDLSEGLNNWSSQASLSGPRRPPASASPGGERTRPRRLGAPA